MASAWDEILTLDLPHAKQDLLITCREYSVCNSIILRVIALKVFQEITTDCGNKIFPLFRKN
jgi:hypothetical protein